MSNTCYTLLNPRVFLMIELLNVIELSKFKVGFLETII